MDGMASQITSLTIVYATVYSGADQRKHQSCAPLAFVRGIHRWPVNSPYKWPVTRKCFHLMTFLFCCITVSRLRHIHNRSSMLADDNVNTYWGRDKIVPISHPTCSNAFSWTKTHEFQLRFYWNLYLKCELIIFQRLCRLWLGAE